MPWQRLGERKPWAFFFFFVSSGRQHDCGIFRLCFRALNQPGIELLAHAIFITHFYQVKHEEGGTQA